MTQPCQKYQDWMVDAFGDELEESLASEMQAHLESCPGCAEIWSDFAEIRRGMEQIETLEPPSELSAARILKAAERKLPRQPASSPIWRFLLSRPAQVAAMMVLILGVGLYTQKWLKTHREPMPPAPFHEPIPAPTLTAPPAAPSPPLFYERAVKEEKARRRDEVKTAKEKAPLLAPKGLDRPDPPPQPEALGGAATGTPGGSAEGILREKAAEEQPMAEPAKPAAVPAPAQDKNLQRMTPASTLEAPRETEADFGIQAKQKALSLPEQNSLLTSAKAKIREGNCAGALPDLLLAQKLGDNSEIPPLIEMCRTRLNAETIPTR